MKYQVTVNVNELQQELPTTNSVGLQAYYGDNLSLTKIVVAQNQFEAINHVMALINNMDTGAKISNQK